MSLKLTEEELNKSSLNVTWIDRNLLVKHVNGTTNPVENTFTEEDLEKTKNEFLGIKKEEQ